MMPNNQELFYPVLTRRDEYKRTNQGNYYSNYGEYYHEIETDCQRRCVYCDITLNEIGGEGMQLDHFRPKSIPKFEHLSNDPNNLVLSCPKCNRLKSKCWPADISVNATYTDDCGFIDPFNTNRKEYFEIEDTGKIKGKKPPSKYIIKLLLLDRMARIQIRRKRLLRVKIKQIAIKLRDKIDKIKDMVDKGIPRSDISKQLTALKDLDTIRTQLSKML